LLGVVFAQFEVVFFQVGHDTAGFIFYGGVDHYQVDVHAQDALILGLVLRA
jgi:hypothetical protein